MPVVDRRSKSIVLRIVYDGPPEAGKATNLRQLCTPLALRQRGALTDPADPDRTPLFDWLDVTDGWAGGHRVRCQLAAVPGQIELARRRRHLLDSADAVVFVADARPGAAPETSAALRSLARGLTSRDVPLLLQANKQDLSGAQLPEPLRDALGLGARVPVIGAEAAVGRGVLETFQLAARLAVEHVRALLVAGEPGGNGANGTAALLRALEADAPDAFDALDAIARAAPRRTSPPRTSPPLLHAVPASETADRSASEEPTRPIRVIRCVPVRTTTPDEARAMIGAAMQATPPMPRGTARTAPPPSSARVGLLARGSKPTAVPASEAAEPVNPATSEAATRPIRMNRFTPARAIMTVPGGGAAMARGHGGAAAMAREPIAIPILAAPTEPPVRPSDSDTLVAIVAVEAQAIEAVTIEPIAIEAITIEREAVDPPPSSAALLASALAEPFLGTDDDPTWELPAVDPSPPVAAGALHQSSVREAIDRQDEPTAPIEVAATPPPIIDAPPADAPPAAASPPPATATDSPPPTTATDSPPTATATDSPPTVTAPTYHLPPVDLPAGLVWPGVCGRAALVAITAPARRIDPPAAWAPAHAIELACGEGWSAHTSDELVFPDLSLGEAALFDAVRWHARLAAFAPSGRTYALSPEGDHVRLWVLTPSQRTMWAAIEDAFARDDRGAAGDLARRGLALVDELREQDISITDLDHVAVDEPLRLLATPWTPHSDRLIVQLQHLFAAAVL